MVGARLVPVAGAALLFLGGCADEGAGPSANPTGPGTAQAPLPQRPGGFGPGNGPGGPEAGPPSGIRKIMMTIGRGPNALTEVIGRELNEPQPPWETIQDQSKNYAQMSLELAKLEPPKGPKESWSEKTEALAGLAAELDKAAQAKDKDAALTAHGELKNSCMACHREHRTMGRGMGMGMGGPPGGFRGGRPGGGPPGGFPGGPPGGGPPGGGPPGGGPPGGFPGGPPGGGPQGGPGGGGPPQ